MSSRRRSNWTFPPFAVRVDAGDPERGRAPPLTNSWWCNNNNINSRKCVSILQQEIPSSNTIGECRWCGKYFGYQNGLRRHVKATHLQMKPFACWYCAYRASRRFMLKSHCQKKHDITDEEFEAKMSESDLLKRQENTTFANWTRF